jgi:hypothetical protein
MKKLVDLGSQERWWCPDCGQLKHKAQYVLDDKAAFGPGRFHAWKCHTPMQRVTVTLTAENPQ